jgi:ribonuclease HI
MNKDMHYVFTDGALKSNIGLIGIYFSFEDEKYSEILKDESCTNQKSELSAIKKALEMIIDKDSQNEYTIVSDSMYALNCITKWYKKWEKTDYKTNEDVIVKHKDTIKEIVHLRQQIKNLSFIHVKGHQKLKDLEIDSFEYFLAQGNIEADKLSKILKTKIKSKKWSKIIE